MAMIFCVLLVDGCDADWTKIAIWICRLAELESTIRTYSTYEKDHVPVLL